PLPLAEAVGGRPLPRPRGPAAADPRARPPRAGVRGVGAGGARLGRVRTAPLLARLLPPGRAGRGERGAARARQRHRGGVPLAYAARRPLRAAARDRERADERGRRAAGIGCAAARGGCAALRGDPAPGPSGAWGGRSGRGGPAGRPESTGGPDAACAASPGLAHIRRTSVTHACVAPGYAEQRVEARGGPGPS